MAVPAAEVLFAIVRRTRSRRSLVLGDRGHPYDRLVTRGWPTLGAALAYVGLELGLSAVALAVARAHGDVPAVAAAAATALVLVVAAAVTGSLVPEAGSDR